MMSDYTPQELTAIANAVNLTEQMAEALNPVEAWPDRIKIESEVQPGVLGWIGMNENGVWVFEPFTGEELPDGE